MVLKRDYRIRHINRNDMLELTRRMTLSRNCMTRLAGCYTDKNGELDDTFNVNFLKLKAADKSKNLAIAKAVPFGKTNEEVKEYCFPKDTFSGQTMWKLLNLIVACGLKNDVLMEIFYEQMIRTCRFKGRYAIDVFHGIYDVPVKGTDNSYEYESEEIYDFIICTAGQVDDEYNVASPDFGFLYPAFRDRSSDSKAIDIYKGNEELVRMLLAGNRVTPSADSLK